MACVAPRSVKFVLNLKCSFSAVQTLPWLNTQSQCRPVQCRPWSKPHARCSFEASGGRGPPPPEPDKQAQMVRRVDSQLPGHPTASAAAAVDGVGGPRDGLLSHPLYVDRLPVAAAVNYPVQALLGAGVGGACRLGGIERVDVQSATTMEEQLVQQVGQARLPGIPCAARCGCQLRRGTSMPNGACHHCCNP